jgi:hypothetical protein
VWLAREADKPTMKRHASQRDQHDFLGEFNEEAGDGAASGGHHPKFNRCHLAGQERLYRCHLADKSWKFHEELSWIKWQGEQVYRTPANNALASQANVDKLLPLLCKYNKEVNLQVMWCNAMLDATTMTDPTLNPAARR